MMSDVEITVTLPEALVRRAQSEGVLLDSARVIAMIEAELARVQAARFLRNAAQTLQGSVSPETLTEELAAAKAERISQGNQ